jgi:aminoglycoside 6'-N-acetyltransferase I
MAELNYKTRQLCKDEKMPYDLLLLADETLEAINRYIFDSEIYVLEQENRIIAVYALQVLGKEEAEIKNIAVAKEWQGHGLGKSLLKDAADRAKSRGFKRLIIGTWDNSGMPICFYQKEGFEKYAVKKDFFKDFFILNYSKPIYDQGVQLIDMVMLKKELR